MPTPNTKSVTLSDGTVAEVPDNLDPASETAYITRLDAANKQTQPTSTWGAVKNFLNQTPAEAVANADTASGGKISGAASWLNNKSGGMLAPAANMAGNVAVNVATLPYDAPAAITNAITHTAQNYGYAKGEPDFPYLAPEWKQAFGVTPSTGPVSSRIENALTIASTGGEGLLPRLVKGTVGEGLAEGGSYAGQKIAEATDPRLAPILETGGAVLANGLPYEQAFSNALSWLGLRGKNAGQTYDAAIDTQKDINATNPDEPMTRPPITVGMVGSPLVKQVERVIGSVPILGQGIDSARENAKEGMVQGRDTAAEAVGASPTNTTPNSPGDALYWGVRRNLTDVGQRMDNIEGTIANNTQGPGGGSALIDVHPLLDALQGMKITTDAAGNVRPNVAPAIGQMINDEIAHVNSARTPEDPQLHAQLQSQADALGAQLNNPNTPQQQIPAIRAQLQQVGQAMDANLKVPFNVLRQMKTLQGATVNAGTGQPTLNGHMGGQVLDAYRDTIQNHVNGLDPQLGAQYEDLNNLYKTASNANRAIGDRNEGTLTSMTRTGMGAPSEVAEVSKTPVWGQAAGNQIRQTGQNTKGEFVPRDFAGVWGGMTPQAKALYTQTDPDAARTLDNVSQLARNYDIPPQTGGMGKLLGALEIMNKTLDKVGLGGALAAMPLGYLGESMPTIRALAGRPQPYFRSLQQNIPALMAVARNQAQQGQPGSTP